MGKKQVLTENQVRIMKRFYGTTSDLSDLVQVVQRRAMLLPKSKRMVIWNTFKKNRDVKEIEDAFDLPITILLGLRKSLDSGKNVQPAIFSECVYAQELADVLGLSFISALDSPSGGPTFKKANAAKYSKPLEAILQRCTQIKIKPRYIYLDNSHASIGLVQAGGPNGIDCILFDLKNDETFFIEFKEAASKTSEPDLPKYKEDGLLVKTDEFIKENPQFESMIDEQLKKNLNFFSKAGSNVNDFTAESVATAVLENYNGKKHADVICVEDIHGVLVMLPAGDVGHWASTRGEIRPAGRNSYSVWTPKALTKIIRKKSGTIKDNKVSIPFPNLTQISGRGGDGTATKLKINSLFFVRVEDVEIKNGIALFDTDKIKQLKPTISAHMFFNNLEYAEVFNYYRKELGI
jgi:hypothetical protein